MTEKVHVHLYGSSWGIGIYEYQETVKDELDFTKVITEIMYGFPPKGMNPNKFTPDYEYCSEEEIAAWKAACTEWNKVEGKK